MCRVMHESISVESLSCTRMWFEWANALFVVFHRQILGEDCETEAQYTHTACVVA